MIREEIDMRIWYVRKVRKLVHDRRHSRLFSQYKEKSFGAKKKSLFFYFGVHLIKIMQCCSVFSKVAPCQFHASCGKGALPGSYAKENLFEVFWIKLNSDCIYHFPIDLKPNGRTFGSKSINKKVNTIGFDIIYPFHIKRFFFSKFY